MSFFLATSRILSLVFRSLNVMCLKYGSLRIFHASDVVGFEGLISFIIFSIIASLSFFISSPKTLITACLSF